MCAKTWLIVEGAQKQEINDCKEFVFHIKGLLYVRFCLCVCLRAKIEDSGKFLTNFHFIMCLFQAWQ